jgi:hypothetical protein
MYLEILTTKLAHFWLKNFIITSSDVSHQEMVEFSCQELTDPSNCGSLMEHIKTIKTTLNWILARDQAQVDGMGVGLDHGEGYGDGNANGAGAGDADGDGRDDLDNHRDEIGDDDGRKKSS